LGRKEENKKNARPYFIIIIKIRGRGEDGRTEMGKNPVK
jgi:hypothetical protein